MSRFFHTLILMLARATEPEPVRRIEYLKAENRILRGKLPKRVTCTPAERARLVAPGQRVGPAIKELITIVHPRTLARWARGEAKSKGKRPRRPGRPRTPEAIRERVVQTANVFEPDVR